MNPFIYPQLASLALATVTPFLAKGEKGLAEEVGPQVGHRVGGLWGAMQEQWSNQPAAADLLRHSLTHPHNRAMLQQMLVQEMKNDGVFAQTIQKHLETIGQDDQGSKFLVQVYGSEVGKIINIAYAEVVNID